LGINQLRGDFAKAVYESDFTKRVYTCNGKLVVVEIPKKTAILLGE
jgi:hypothetical protein